MQILDPQDVKKDRFITDEETRARSRAMATEEARLAKAINLARTEAQEEIERIDNDYKEFKAEKEAEKQNLEKEVAELENRRKEALKPIEQLRTEAEAFIRANAEIADELERQKKGLAADKEKIIDLAEAVKDREAELIGQNKKIDRRKEFIEHEEIRIKNSTNTLAEQWLKYHKAVNDLNIKTKKVLQKEAEILAIDKAVEVRSAELDKRQIEQDDRDRALTDKYNNLQKARDEILGRET